MERWQDPLTGETAIINKWRGETAVDQLDAIRLQLLNINEIAEELLK